MRRPTAYDRDQHQLICEHLGLSDNPNEPGDTAFEAVMTIRESNRRLFDRLLVLEKAVTGNLVVISEDDGYLRSEPPKGDSDGW